MTNWFTSDLHLGHKTMWEKHRQTFKTLQEHDDTICENILQTVSAGDNLYLLGDLFWKWSSKMKEQFFIKLKKKRLNTHIVLGNHDKGNFKLPSVVWVGQIKDIFVNKTSLTLCHYPLLVYNKSHYGSILLYGHIHKNDSTWYHLQTLSLILGKAVNVNTELHNYKPLSFEEIIAIAASQPDNFDLIKKEFNK